MIISCLNYQHALFKGKEDNTIKTVVVVVVVVINYRINRLCVHSTEKTLSCENYKPVTMRPDRLYIQTTGRVANRFFRIQDWAYSEGRDSGFWQKRTARFGIVILNGPRDLAILPSGIREITFFSGKVGRKCAKRIQL